MKTKDIHQLVTFNNVSPHQVYEALMDSRKHAAFTGEDAQISREIGEKSSAYGDWIEAYNIELVPDEKIVQKWRAIDWPEEHFSVVTFEFSQDGAGESDQNESGDGSFTTLKFTQTEVPAEFAKEIDKGWQTEYWQKMQAYFAENS